MKNRWFLCLLLLFVLSVRGYTQDDPYPRWENLDRPAAITALAIEDKYIRIGATSGFFRYNRSTQEYKWFNPTDNELAGNYVRTIAVDHQGVKWIGTNYGITTFHEGNWNIYPSNDTSNHVCAPEQIEVDEAGNIWVVSYLNGLYKYDGKAWNQVEDGDVFPFTTNNGKQYFLIRMFDNFITLSDSGTKENLALMSRPSHVSHHFYTGLAVDDAGNKWISSYDGLLKVENKRCKLYDTTNTDLPANKVPDIEFDEQNRIWLATEKGVVQFSLDSSTIFNKLNTNLPNNEIDEIVIHKGSEIWVTGDEFFAGFNGETWQIFNPPLQEWNATHHNQAFVKDRQGTIWQATKCGYYKLEGEKNWVEADYFPDTLETFTAAAVDSAGNHWLGTYKYGLVRFNGTNWQYFDTMNSALRDNDVNGITIDGNGAVWVATDGGLVRIDKGRWQVYDTTNSRLQNNQVIAIATDRQGKIWATTEKALVKWDGAQFQRYRPDSPLKFFDDVNDFEIDHAGNKWIALEYYDLRKFRNGKWTVFDSDTSEISFWSINTIAPDKAGNLWIGHDDGLTRMNGNERKTYTPANSGLPGKKVKNLLVDESTGTLWIATRGSMVRFAYEK